MEYNTHLFNIYSQVKNELADFYKTKIKIAGSKDNKKMGYDFSQADTINLIEYVNGSKYEKGDRDSEGQQKFYLNSSTFRADVASKQIDIDLSNILFVPSDNADESTCTLARHMFKKWAKEKRFSETLNELVERFPVYGSLVVKKIGKSFEIVPITQLRNEQKATSLNEASYVIIEHNMKAWEAAAMPDWDMSGLDYSWDDDITIYERYGRVPAKFIDETADEKESVDTMSILVCNHRGKEENSGILFMEEIKERPFEEAHWKKRDGRWLGVGVIEENLENQKARNLVFNLRMRSAVWSSKSIFQSTDDAITKNLVAEVRDGDVLQINGAGQITPVNTQTKSLADYNSVDETVEQNSEQKTFTYEVATGESMKSGTPFRLGAILANSANSFFAFKREKLELLVRNVLNEFVLPEFEKDFSKEEIIYLADGEEAFDFLFDKILTTKTNNYIKNQYLSGQSVPTPEDIAAFKQRVLREKGHKILNDTPLKNIKYKIDIIMSGENVDVDKKITTYSTLYQIYSQLGDPRATAYLKKIERLQGIDSPRDTGTPLAPITGQPVGQLPQINQTQNEQAIA